MLDWMRAIILGLVEGLTEFIPVSSTGHLLIANALLGLENDRFWETFVVLIQLGAILAVVAVYFAIKEGSTTWPPSDVEVGTYIPTMITITALMSGFSVQWGIFAARRNDGRNAAMALILTLFLGLAMANLEWLSFVRSGFGFNDHTYGTLYDVLIGYHLLHLLAAIVVVLVLSFRTMAGHFSGDRHDALRAGAVFWQYTNIIWFVVVTVLFLFSRHG